MAVGSAIVTVLVAASQPQAQILSAPRDPYVDYYERAVVPLVSLIAFEGTRVEKRSSHAPTSFITALTKYANYVASNEPAPHGASGARHELLKANAQLRSWIGASDVMVRDCHLEPNAAAAHGFAVRCMSLAGSFAFESYQETAQDIGTVDATIKAADPDFVADTINNDCWEPAFLRWAQSRHIALGGTLKSEYWHPVDACPAQ